MCHQSCKHCCHHRWSLEASLEQCTALSFHHTLPGVGSCQWAWGRLWESQHKHQLGTCPFLCKGCRHHKQCHRACWGWSSDCLCRHQQCDIGQEEGKFGFEDCRHHSGKYQHCSRALNCTETHLAWGSRHTGQWRHHTEGYRCSQEQCRLWLCQHICQYHHSGHRWYKLAHHCTKQWQLSWDWCRCHWAPGKHPHHGTGTGPCMSQEHHCRPQKCTCPRLCRPCHHHRGSRLPCSLAHSCQS